MNPKTLFEKIIEGNIPSKIEYQDEQCIVIHDIYPQAPIHLLIIPRKPIPRIVQADEIDKTLLGHLLWVGRLMAENLGCEEGFRLVINNGLQAGETIPHLHVHFLAKRRMAWPPG